MSKNKNQLHKLKKSLGLFDLFCISSGAMISSGLFILPGLAFAKTGPSIIISYLIASIAIIPIILSKAELATAMPKSGGNYFFIDRSMGPLMGMLGGLADWASLSLKSAFSLLGVGTFLLLIHSGITLISLELIAIALCVIFALINIVGVNLTRKFQVVLVTILIGLLVLYVIAGFFFIQPDHFTPFAPLGLGSIFATAGFVFISYAGLTKIVGVAEEVKNPGRNIPLALFLSWGVISLLYVLVLLVTVGLVDPVQLKDSLIPISLGANVFSGWGGGILLGIAALIAFATTANAALLTASRTPMAMSKDELLPGFLKKISKRGTPTLSIIFTSSFIIFIILFLTLENLVKAASTMILLLFIFISLSVIIMRESKMKYYQPKFRSPLYPWVQIFGIVAYGFLIFKIGVVPFFLAGVFMACGVAWYFIYAHRRIKREYALLHAIDRAVGIEPTNHLINEELREIIAERDDVAEK